MRWHPATIRTVSAPKEKRVVRFLVTYSDREFGKRTFAFASAQEARGFARPRGGRVFKKITEGARVFARPLKDLE